MTPGEKRGELECLAVRSGYVETDRPKAKLRCSCGFTFWTDLYGLRDRKWWLCRRCIAKQVAHGRGTTGTYCGLCRSPEHTALTCHRRQKSRICEQCGCLPHRVQGKRCDSCGLRAGPDVVERQGLGIGRWNWLAT